MNWDELIQMIDYHHKKWYMCDGEDWQEVSQGTALDVLQRSTDDVSRAMKLFLYRDRESTARHYKR